MYTSPEEVESVVRLFVEGCSIRSIGRITGLHQATILKVLELAGARCERLMESRIHHLPVADVQCDEMWGFATAKRSATRPAIPNAGMPTAL
jgi:hypothetical protein